MTPLASSAPLPDLPVRVDWQKVFLFVVAVLASTVLLKIGPIQYLELIYFGLIFLLALVYVQKGYVTHWYRPFLWIAVSYLVFCIAAFSLALASLRFDFYLPAVIDPLKRPVLISLSRILELVASVAAMLYMAQLFRKDLVKARFAMRVYFWTGFASGVYSLLSLPIDLAGIGQWGAYSNLHRLRGFYNEGGPYGLYVISVLLVGIALDQLRWEPRVRVRWALGTMAIVFFLSGSKAALLAALTVIAVNGIFAQSMARRLTIAAAGLAVLLIIPHFVDLRGALRQYQLNAAAYERLSHLHPKDGNFVYGRVAGAFLVPRMIAAHPLTGIGWGNYGILRNAPEYRGAAVFVEDADDPGLGIFGLAAETGLPLLAFLIGILFLPFFYLRALRAPAYLTNLALLQPIVHLFGAQLNLTYPWVATAFALGVAYGLKRDQPFKTGKPALPASLISFPVS